MTAAINKRKNILQWLDKAIFASLCPILYFLPISIALVESFGGLAIFLYIVQKFLYTHWKFSKKSFFEEAFAPAMFMQRPLYLYLFTVLLSVIFSQYRWVSLFAFFAKTMEGVLLFIILIDHANSKKRLKILLGIVLFTAVLISASAIYQHFTHVDFIRGNVIDDQRVDATFRHSNDLGTFIVVTGLVTFVFFLYQIYNARYSIPLAALFMLLLSVLTMTYSRGAWLGFLFGAIFLIFLNARRGWLIMVIVTVFYIIAIPFLRENRHVDLFNDTVTHQESMFSFIQDMAGSGRAAYWEKAVEVINSAPVFGTGLNTYSKVVQRYPSLFGGGYAHNCYLQMTAETGFVGLFGFLYFIWSLFSNVLKRNLQFRDGFLRALTLGFSAALIGFLVQSFLDTTFYSVQLGNLMWLVMGLIMAAHQTDVKLTKSKPSL